MVARASNKDKNPFTRAILHLKQGMWREQDLGFKLNHAFENTDRLQNKVCTSYPPSFNVETHGLFICNVFYNVPNSGRMVTLVQVYTLGGMGGL